MADFVFKCHREDYLSLSLAKDLTHIIICHILLDLYVISYLGRRLLKGQDIEWKTYQPQMESTVGYGAFSSISTCK
jgi:hypothetical protein